MSHERPRREAREPARVEQRAEPLTPADPRAVVVEFLDQPDQTPRREPENSNRVTGQCAALGVPAQFSPGRGGDEASPAPDWQ